MTLSTVGGGFDRAVYSFRTDNIATGGIRINLAAGTRR